MKSIGSCCRDVRWPEKSGSMAAVASLAALSASTAVDIVDAGEARDADWHRRILYLCRSRMLERWFPCLCSSMQSTTRGCR